MRTHKRHAESLERAREKWTDALSEGKRSARLESLDSDAGYGLDRDAELSGL
jgi:hypothetical protein